MQKWLLGKDRSWTCVDIWKFRAMAELENWERKKNWIDEFHPLVVACWIIINTQLEKLELPILCFLVTSEASTICIDEKESPLGTASIAQAELRF